MTLRKERRWIELKAYVLLGIKDAILRGDVRDGSTIAAGHPVLGCPVGTDAYVENVIRASAKRAAALIPQSFPFSTASLFRRTPDLMPLMSATSLSASASAGGSRTIVGDGGAGGRWTKAWERRHQW